MLENEEERVKWKEEKKKQFLFQQRSAKQASNYPTIEKKRITKM